jgi:hypothetical protein
MLTIESAEARKIAAPILKEYDAQFYEFLIESKKAFGVMESISYEGPAEAAIREALSALPCEPVEQKAAEQKAAEQKAAEQKTPVARETINSLKAMLNG